MAWRVARIEVSPTELSMSQGRVSPEQVAIADQIGFDVRSDSFEVAAARIFDAVATAIGHESPSPSTGRQREFAASLGRDVSADSQRVASAKIGEALQERNERALVDLNLRTGDRVIRVERFEHDGEWHSLEREFIVSSIHSSGRIFFKGGNGQGAWPTQVRKVNAGRKSSPGDAG